MLIRCEAEVGTRPQDSMMGTDMILLGLILLIVGMLVGMSLLTTIGGVLIVVGAVLWILGASGRAVGGRKHYF
ncbi:hypothetical protein [Streptomyces fulvorobeus]|uniref:Membrane protein implicated in regulation of membrane protease activity n=1 Tax=Streptomyces fulvorobeus TaxID=284028 RepID=A0A7J0BZ76_9ACTN|nr:hypothetical protein [Streptomyces fulvorobeus]NYE39268.1 membrane protein implicated in regulation of membrane protease activity [Streptomyces fulvorobeus]GFM95478.1 hypothetical protein Sfulv_02890 [Streptomyces fulvorobeus]